MKSFANVNPKDLGQVVATLQEARQAGKKVALVGGGSDLLGMIKEGLAAPDLLVNLKNLKEFEGISSDSDGVRIGGLTTLDTIIEHSLIRSNYTVLSEGAATVATPQIRNVGTLAGNLCQRPWCWYLREGFPCFKNGGNMCYSSVGENQFNAIFGGGPSFIVHPSDTAPALVALGANFRIVGPDGERIVPASEFFILPSQDIARENVLKEDEILVEIQLPATAKDRKSTYVKIMDRDAWTHAMVSVAVVLDVSQGICSRAEIVLGGVAPIPWQVSSAASMLVGQQITEDLAGKVGQVAVEGARPLAKNGYKVQMTQALVKRTLISLTRQAA